MDKYLVVAISNHGYSEEIMSCAKKCGAKGGTILKGKGSASNDIKKFFGITISPEKEILFIVLSENIKNDVMMEITKKYGVASEAHTVVFSIKVDKTIGILEE